MTWLPIRRRKTKKEMQTPPARTLQSKQCLVLARWHLRLEPVQRPLQHIAPMLGIAKTVPFIGINHQLCLYPFSPQRMPELEALRSRALAVAVANHHQRRSLYLVNKFDRRALRIHLRVVIHRRSEERDHPLVDRVLSVVALPVRNPGPRHRRPEPRRLRHPEHRHEPAIAPARQPLALLVDRKALLQQIHSSQNVAQVAVPEVLPVRLSEV